MTSTFAPGIPPPDCSSTCPDMVPRRVPSAKRREARPTATTPRATTPTRNRLRIALLFPQKDGLLGRENHSGAFFVRKRARGARERGRSAGKRKGGPKPAHWGKVRRKNSRQPFFGVTFGLGAGLAVARAGRVPSAFKTTKSSLRSIPL